MSESALSKAGRQSYEDWKAELLADPAMQALYEAEAAKKALWLQLVEARLRAGLTQQELAKRMGVSQAQVARIEQQGYERQTLSTLRRYVQALGPGHVLEVQIRQIAAAPLPASNTLVPGEEPGQLS